MLRPENTFMSLLFPARTPYSGRLDFIINCLLKNYWIIPRVFRKAQEFLWANNTKFTFDYTEMCIVKYEATASYVIFIKEINCLDFVTKKNARQFNHRRYQNDFTNNVFWSVNIKIKTIRWNEADEQTKPNKITKKSYVIRATNLSYAILCIIGANHLSIKQLNKKSQNTHRPSILFPGQICHQSKMELMWGSSARRRLAYRTEIDWKIAKIFRFGSRKCCSCVVRFNSSGSRSDLRFQMFGNTKQKGSNLHQQYE